MRARKDLVYVLVAAPLTAFGFAWVLTGAVVAAVLPFTALGVPVLAAMVPGSIGGVRLCPGSFGLLLPRQQLDPAEVLNFGP